MQPHTGPVPDRVPWTIRDVTMATAIPFGIVAVSLGVTLLYDVEMSGDTSSAIPPWSIFIFQGVLIGLVWFFGIRKYKVPWRTLGFQPAIGRGVRWLPWLALAISLSVTLFYSYVVTLLGIDFLIPDQDITADCCRGWPWLSAFQ